MHLFQYNTIRAKREGTKMKVKLLLSSIIVTLLMLVTGCNVTTSANIQKETIKVKKDHAKKLTVNLKLGAGSLKVSKGAKDWVNGTVKYNKKHKPIVDYNLVGNKGTVNIKEPSEFTIGNVKNKWNLTLSNKVPIDLSVEAGASSTYLDLKDLKLRKLDVNAGVGEIKIDLSGKWEKSFDAKIDTGVGKSTFILPSDVGVKIISEKGIGTADYIGLISKGNGVYVNEAYKKSNVILTIQTQLGIGDVTFKTK
jgi:hypothetical protein